MKFDGSRKVYRYPTHILGILLVSLSFFWLTACADAPTVGPGDPIDEDTEVTIEGTATDDGGYGEQSDSGSENSPSSSHHAGVSGAVVTGASVASDGNTSTIEGETETETDGTFSLDLQGLSEVMLITATTSEFEGHALVRNTGATTIRAMPITVESTVESDTYVETKQRDDDEVREADVALYVDQSLAADVDAGDTSTSEVAISIHDAVVAEFEARGHTAGSPPNNEIQNEKEEAFINLQSNLAVATSAGAERDAIHSFEETMAMLDVELGGSAQAQAQTRQASSAAAIHADANLSSNAEFALRQRAETVAAIATAHAVSAIMEVDGLEAEASAVEESGATLVGNIRAASSQDDLAAAKAEFESTTQALLAAGLEVDESELEQAQSLMASVLSELQSEITAAASPQAIASAYANFYADARSVADANEDLVPGGTGTAEVLITLSAFSSIN